MQNHTERYSDLVVDVINNACTGGLSLTDSLRRTAKTEGLKPFAIEIVGGLVNRAASLVHFSKAADASRADAFDITDPPAVIEELFGVEHAAQSSYATLFHRGMRPAADRPTSDVKRRASVVKMKENAQLVRRFAEEAGSALVVADKLQSAYEADREAVFHRAGAILDELCERVAALDDKGKKAYVRRTVNLFNDDGRLLLTRIASEVDMPEIPERSHYSAVFPPEPVYTGTQDLVSLLRRSARINDSLRLVSRMAKDSFLQDFFAEGAARMIPQNQGSRLKSAENLQAPRDLRQMDALEDVGAVAASTAAELMRYRTRRQFMEAVLDNPNLRQHKMTDLAEAFNSVSQMDESALGKPFLMGNLMLQLLNSGGVVDTFQLGQMAEIGSRRAKQLAQEDVRRSQDDPREFAKDEAEKLVHIQQEQDSVMDRVEAAKEEHRNKRDTARKETLQKKLDRLDPMKKRTNLAARTWRRVTQVTDDWKDWKEEQRKDKEARHKESLDSADRRTDLVMDYGIDRIEAQAATAGMEPEDFLRVHDAVKSNDLLDVSPEELISYKVAVKGLEDSVEADRKADEEIESERRKRVLKTEDDRRQAEREEEAERRKLRGQVANDISGVIRNTGIKPGTEDYSFISDTAKSMAGIAPDTDIEELGEQAKRGDKAARDQYSKWLRFVGRVAPEMNEVDKMTSVLDVRGGDVQNVFKGSRNDIRRILALDRSGNLGSATKDTAKKLKAIAMTDMVEKAGQRVVHELNVPDSGALPFFFKELADRASLPRDFPPDRLMELAALSRMPKDLIEAAEGSIPMKTRFLATTSGFKDLADAAESVGVTLRALKSDPFMVGEAGKVSKTLESTVRDLRSKYGEPDL